MRRLAEPIKRRIVEHLACFLTAPEVCTAIAEEFGIKITPRHVRAYNPECYQYAGTARWVEYHRVTRERFHASIADVPIAQKVWRLWRIQNLFDEAYLQRDYRQASLLLEQAARECGAY